MERTAHRHHDDRTPSASPYASDEEIEALATWLRIVATATLVVLALLVLWIA